MKFSQILFHFLDEFFIQESEGKGFHTSQSCQKERWSLCQSCEHFDEPEEGCKHCGCYLPHKIKDPFASCPIEKWIANSEQWNIEHYDLVKNKLIERHPELKEQIHELD